MSKVSLSHDEFHALATLLHGAAGLSFDDSRRESLGYCIAERMRSTGSADVSSYLALLAGPAGTTERQALLDEVTIPETHFFRNPPQIRALRKHVLPELLRQGNERKRLRIWSAGCSTGEEPYTIAMLIRELLPASAGWDIKIIATDVSTRALAAAQRGRYSERAFVMTEPRDLSRWFILDATTGAFVVRDEVRELVEFRHHNLVTDPAAGDAGDLDLVLCRNVTIYFDRDTTRALMGRLHSQLRDGGYLFLGHAETLWQVSDDFSLVPLGDAFVYRRLDVPDLDAERRSVLPDRRTEDELVPFFNDRRRGATDRRDDRDTGTIPTLPRLVTPALPVIGPQIRPSVDPLLAVRVALTAGRYAEAADLAADVIVATPLLAEGYYLQGAALTNLARDSEALTVLRKATYLDPELGFAHFLLAGALERRGERSAAARSYRAAASTLGTRPSDTRASELGGRRVDELIELCEKLARQAELATGGAA